MSFSQDQESSFWPGFVDMLSALLMVILFVFMIFAISNFYLQDLIGQKENSLFRAQSLLEEQERKWKEDLQRSKKETETLHKKLTEVQGLTQQELARLIDLHRFLAQQMEGQKQVADDFRRSAQKLLKNETELKNQIQNKDIQIKNLSQQLQVLMAEKLKEMWTYRSEFLGKLRNALGKREDVRLEGDRFVFQSEVLFGLGSVDIGVKGKQELKVFARALKEVMKTIPKDVDWVLRVDGHTDNFPLKSGGRFTNNLELSSARALAVVNFLVQEGIPAVRLVAAGFGEHHPISKEEDKNRRIELVLDQKKTCSVEKVVGEKKLGEKKAEEKKAPVERNVKGKTG
ncbi:MAG: hypothetical protein BGO07_02330 [Alphaproteobacteria bacterium 40-19]|nr:MAG: hypothetical protein BGO07_02330 [Alphaproteobacteria bacterium 40-19]